MREHLSSQTIANEIRMTRTVFTGAFLLLEGKHDCMLFRNFVDRSRCHIQDCGGKDTVIDVIRLLEHTDDLVAIIDADFEHVEQSGCFTNNIVLTDLHDLELTVLDSKALDKVLSIHGSEQKITKWLDSKQKGDVLQALLHAAAPLGHLRWASLRTDANLEFKELNYNRLFDRTRIEIVHKDFVQRIVSRSPNAVCAASELEQEMRELAKKGHNLKQVCNGHDAVAILGLALRSAWGTNESNHMNEDNTRKALWLAYDWKSFERTAMFASIMKWSVDSGLEVFREG